jgi:hypothetical protein
MFTREQNALKLNVNQQRKTAALKTMPGCYKNVI